MRRKTSAYAKRTHLNPWGQFQILGGYTLARPPRPPPSPRGVVRYREGAGMGGGCTCLRVPCVFMCVLIGFCVFLCVFLRISAWFCLFCGFECVSVRFCVFLCALEYSCVVLVFLNVLVCFGVFLCVFVCFYVFQRVSVCVSLCFSVCL